MSQPTLVLVDQHGRRQPLGALLARGGEGAIHAVEGQPAYVAKIYHRPPDHAKQAKLAAMVQARSERLAALAAWPTTTLHAQPGGPVVGFLMPRVFGHKVIHTLYSPKSRLVEFPHATWRFLVHAAANVARAVEVVHTHGHVIGDINHGSVLVSGEATVRLIDCDSFQIRADGRVYPCTVGVPDFTPPELHGRRLAGLERSTNHDAFGLAVLIFHLLFLGRHPYVGRHRGGEMPVGRAIAEHRFAYGRQADTYLMAPPPGSLPLAAVSAPVAELFERAFAPERTAGGRPAAREWVEVLADLAQHLQTCSYNAAHVYAPGLAACPWCAIEHGVSARLFPLVLPPIQPADSHFAFEAVWAGIEAVPSPGPAPALPSVAAVRVKPTAGLVGRRRAHRRQRNLAIGLVVGLILVWGALPLAIPLALALIAATLVAGWWYLARGVSPDPLPLVTANLKAARKEWETVERRWLAEAGEIDFVARRRELEARRTTYLSLDALRRRRLVALQTSQRERQLQRYLERHSLQSADIPGLGPGRKATLLSFGIETAADVTGSAISAVPGFDPELVKRLLAWRQEAEATFQFDAWRGFDPADQAAVEREIQARRVQLERELSAGAAELAALRERALAARDMLWPAVNQAILRLAQAEIDAEVLT